jgi:membrane-associated phospholipid phosphatase
MNYQVIKLTPSAGYSCLVAAVLITFSTLYLRYHYFTDVLGALILIVFGLFFGGIYTCGPVLKVFAQARSLFCDSVEDTAIGTPNTVRFAPTHR